jgi:MFS family permease
MVLTFPRFLRALHARNYRLFFCGQVVSLVGTWMTLTASLWLAYHLQSSALLLGVVGFAGQAPIFFLSPIAGVWVDRLDKRRLLLLTQLLSLLQSGALAAMTLTGTINIWTLIALNVVQGVVNAFDLPARQAFVIQLVDRREDLGNAIALNSSMFNLARLLGPAFAGLLIAAIGAGYCYMVDAISYVAVLISLWRVRPRLVANPRAGGERVRRFGRSLAELRDGFAYAFGFAPIGNVILLVAATAFTGFAAPVLLPILARDVFGGDARTLGWLMSASGVGALGGALYLSTRVTVRGLGEVITGGGIAMGAGLIGVAFCHRVELGAVCMLFAGLGGVLLMASSNTIVQSLTEEDKRGRVMSLFAMAFTGTTPLGNLAIGALAGGALGVRWTLVLAGACCALTSCIFFLRLPVLRRFAAPILEKLDDVASESVTT